MKPEKVHRILSLAMFIYSIFLAFAVLVEGQYSLKVSVIAVGYFSIMSWWVYYWIGQE